MRRRMRGVDWGSEVMVLTLRVVDANLDLNLARACQDTLALFLLAMTS